ncbi:MAG: hypothetical protein ACYCYP_08230 [Leptospirales bacterium]
MVKRDFFLFVLAGSLMLCLGSFVEAVADPGSSPAPVTEAAAPPGTGTTNPETPFNEIGKWGVGFEMAPIALVTNLPGTIIPGFLDVRYWFHSRWGFDGGIGIGIADVSPGPVATLFAVHAEPLYRLIEQQDFVFFTDLNVLSALSFQNASNAGAFLLSYGFGIEKEFVPAPVAISLQWDPLSLNVYSLPGQVPNVSYGFLGTPVNFMVGFHYYF